MYRPYGIIPPIVTPFDADGAVDLEKMTMLSLHLLDNGVHGLFPFGTTGEFYAVELPEYTETLRTVREAAVAWSRKNGRPVQLLAGANHITTRGVIRLIRKVEQVGGYDAVSVLTPMFIGQTQDELYTHFRTIAESTALPVVLYNNRPKTNITIAPATAARLAVDCPNIVAIKDSTGDMTTCEEYLRLCRERRPDFAVMMGRDTMIFAGLSYGCTGAVASCANVAPRLVSDIYEKYHRGDLSGALRAQYALAPLRIATGLGTFPEVIKEALELQGIPVGKCLPPIQRLSADEREQLRDILARMGLLA